MDVATALGIKCFNPKIITVDSMPTCFDRRGFKREDGSNFKIVCNNCETDCCYGSTRAVDICEYGLRIEQPKSKISKGERVNLAVSLFSNPKNVTVKNGMVVWSKEEEAGIELEEPVELSRYLV